MVTAEPNKRRSVLRLRNATPDLGDESNSQKAEDSNESKDKASQTASIHASGQGDQLGGSAANEQASQQTDEADKNISNPDTASDAADTVSSPNTHPDESAGTNSAADVNSSSQQPAKVPSLYNRTYARLCAVQAVYELAHGGGPLDEVLHRHIQERVPTSGQLLFSSLVSNVNDKCFDFDSLLLRCLEPSGWALDRLDAVLQAILRVATVELWMMRRQRIQAAQDSASGNEPMKEIDGVPFDNDPEVEIVSTAPTAAVLIQEYIRVTDRFFIGTEAALLNAVLEAAVDEILPRRKRVISDAAKEEA